ncbi:MAG: efflux RND transporter periplasmic adaptor subunit [Acidobacteria bacterium]|nr:MAG: efflux RND transporter periplasmic adaptor subunit [Acidobacteriota bacterium]
MGIETPPSPPLPPAAASRHHRRGLIWLLVILGVVYAGFRYRQVALPPPKAAGPGRTGAAARGGPAVPVVAVAAASGSVPVYLRGIGSVTPNNTVTVHPQVGGEILHVLYREGQFVRAGEALLDIDPRPYEATLAQAEGQLAHDTALYKDDEIDYQRYLTLYQQNIVAKQQVDAQQALVSEYKGAMATDQAAIKAAQLNITYSHITAPIAGRLGLRLVDPGNVVQAGAQTSLVVITQIQPIAVLFNLPQEDLPQVYPALLAGQHPAVDAFDSNNTQLLARGRLETIDNSIDPTTGTFRCKALFDNADNKLFPSEFVNARMRVGSESGLTVVPPAAIQRGPNGSYVFAVDAQHAVHVVPVTEKITEGNQVGLAAGLAPGTEVVIDGADRLQDGTHVRARVQPLPPPLTAEALRAAAPAVAGARTAAPAAKQPRRQSPIKH